MLEQQNLTGPWAGLPVAWTDDDQFDEPSYRADVVACCEAGVPGVYTGGTTGEFYGMEFNEFKAVTRATIDECKPRGVPVIIGCTSTYTLGVVRRAEVAAELGADGIQVALPFWLEVEDDQVVPFYQNVMRAAGDLALSIYETTRAKKILTINQHLAIKNAVPRYLMVKANSNTVGNSPDGCRTLSEFVNVFVGEREWSNLGPEGARGGCSAVVYWNPRITLEAWQNVLRKDWPALDAYCDKIGELVKFMDEHFGTRGYTDTAYDRLGGLVTGFLRTSCRSREPYTQVAPADIDLTREWCRQHFPEFLKL